MNLSTHAWYWRCRKEFMERSFCRCRHRLFNWYDAGLRIVIYTLDRKKFVECSMEYIPPSFRLFVPSSKVFGWITSGDPVWGDPSTKSPCPIASGYGIFCLRSFGSKTGVGSQTKNPSFASLRGDLVEVGGGFEPPFPVLQTDS